MSDDPPPEPPLPPNTAVALALADARLRESMVAARIRQALMRPHEAPRLLTDALETLENGLRAGDLTDGEQKPQRRDPAEREPACPRCGHGTPADEPPPPGQDRILRLYAQRVAIHDIARDTGTTRGDVKKHLDRICARLQCGRRNLVATARKEGLL